MIGIKEAPPTEIGIDIIAGQGVDQPIDRDTTPLHLRTVGRQIVTDTTPRRTIDFMDIKVATGGQTAAEVTHEVGFAVEANQDQILVSRGLILLSKRRKGAIVPCVTIRGKAVS